MTEQTNNYFKAMQLILEEYSSARKQRYDERTKLTQTGNIEALKAWDEREANFPKPYSPGFMDAYWTWMDNKEKDNNLFEVNTLPWKSDAHDFIRCLQEAGINEFVITEKSTGLISMLYCFSKEGCTIKDLCTVRREEMHWGEKQTVENQGILIEIN